MLSGFACKTLSHMSLWKGFKSQCYPLICLRRGGVIDVALGIVKIDQVSKGCLDKSREGKQERCVK